MNKVYIFIMRKGPGEWMADVLRIELIRFAQAWKEGRHIGQTSSERWSVEQWIVRIHENYKKNFLD